MELIVKICLDVSYQNDRNKLIRKYLIPILLNEPTKLLEIENDILSDVFNNLEKEEIDILHPSMEKIIGEFDKDNFLEINWKIGKCFKCEKLSCLLKCKKEHDENCFYSTTGCGKLFCEDCVFQICSEEDMECSAIRCEECSNY